MLAPPPIKTALVTAAAQHNGNNNEKKLPPVDVNESTMMETGRLVGNSDSMLALPFIETVVSKKAAALHNSSSDKDDEDEDKKLPPPDDSNESTMTNAADHFFNAEEYIIHLIGNSFSIPVVDHLLRPLSKIFQKREYKDFQYKYAWEPEDNDDPQELSWEVI